jgi:hypothetical protein
MKKTELPYPKRLVRWILPVDTYLDCWTTLSQFQASRYTHSLQRDMKTVINGEQPVLVAVSLDKKKIQPGMSGAT